MTRGVPRIGLAQIGPQGVSDVLVDVHAHIGPGDPSPTRPAALITYAQHCGFDYVLVANNSPVWLSPTGPDEVDVNRLCRDTCAHSPHLRPVYHAHPGRPGSSLDVLRGALRSEPFVAVALAATPHLLAAPTALLDSYFAELAAIGRPALVLVSSAERTVPAGIYDYARRHPDVAVVFCVCGGPHPRAAILDVVGRAVRADDADLYVDTAHASADDIDAAIEALGPDRLVFGSDAPGTGERHAAAVAETLARLRALLPADEFQRVCGDNAARLFGLGGARR